MSKQERINEELEKKSYHSHRKAPKKSWTSNLTIQTKKERTEENSSSVITKSTNPKVIIQSENFEGRHSYNKHKLMKFVLFIVICIIILITFFLSLKTYNTVNELYNHFM